MNIKELLGLTKKTSEDIIKKVSENDSELFKKTISASIIFGGALFAAGSVFSEASIIDAISNSMSAVSGKDETTIHDFFVLLINPETTYEKIRMAGGIIIMTSPFPAISAKIIDMIIEIKKLKEQLESIEGNNKKETLKMDLSAYVKKDPSLSDFMNLWIKGYNSEKNKSFFSVFEGSKKSINLASIILLKNSNKVDKEFFDQTISNIREMKRQGKSISDIIRGSGNESKLKRIKELKVMYSVSSSKETKKFIVSSLSDILLNEKPDLDIAKIIGFNTASQDKKRVDNSKTM